MTCKKGLMMIVFLYLISLAKTSFVTVKAQQTCVRVNENSAVNLTCLFTNGQGNVSDDVKVSWTHNSTLTRNNSNKNITGVYTTWNATTRSGQTVLHIPAVSKEQEGTYTCVVLISGSTDYKKINIEVINSTQEDNVETTTETTVENKTDTIRYVSACNVLTFIIMLVSVLI
ncbi:CNPV167 Ig-like domain protein [Canarypox virus]|uniref:CNPV167 Ig-like domain protein n=1 Tax=Canarypox virus TaxID=44088 RepID=Q6VZI0_CNPV|nr:CNPV167 Ig-like domain protein [Canarypox virus]AAR83513.1 CNPV167 Ig-like domain protein [Canarypox virus]AWD84643.1 Ig-like domain protein [Canarypox virus]